MPLSDQPISRRSFLGAATAAAAGGALGLVSCGGNEAGPDKTPFAGTGLGYGYWNDIFEAVSRGFIRNALRTSDTFAVCDYPGGTYLKNFIAASGKTCDSVARMLPALAARLVSPAGGAVIEADGVEYDLSDLLVKALANATDPECPDFWQYSKKAAWDQRQVESSIVAWSLWLARDSIMDRFTPAQRRNIQRWLASCTVVPTRTNNWALFTAVNHAARIALSERWSEFSGDEEFFRADLAAVDGMYRGDGWYSDTGEGHAFDYYNFWVFASHGLYWDAMVGERFPELREKYRERLRLFLETTPFFFGGNGSHVLFGRSLIYRWAVLTPLVLAHGLGQWPLSVGLLRRVCNRNLEFLWEAGAYDGENGRLRETLSPHSHHDVCESYINSGHPYWGMQAFHAMSLGPDDPFWSVPEEPLPVERGDFRRVIEAPGLLLDGVGESGQVRLWQARCNRGYPNKYFNFSWSSHFPWNVGMVDGKVPPDCALTFRADNGDYGRRSGDFEGEILSGQALVWRWSAQVGTREVRVESMSLVEGEFEWRAHRVDFDGAEELIAAEHTYALGLGLEERAGTQSGGVWEWAANEQGRVVFARAVFGFNTGGGFGGFEGRDDLNSLYPRAGQASLSARLKSGAHTLIAALYASPAPLPLDKLLERSAEIPPRIAEFAGLEL